jgi:hypothetical protein
MYCQSLIVLDSILPFKFEEMKSIFRDAVFILDEFFICKLYHCIVK